VATPGTVRPMTSDGAPEPTTGAGAPPAVDDATERFRRWTASGVEGSTPVAAATVILVRDAPAGLEVLMLRRNSQLAFVGGMWVFPGGRVDPGDVPDPIPDDPLEAELAAARAAAVREAAEEAGLVVDAEGLVPFSHWTPPPITPKRFLTWFFLGAAPMGGVTIDGGEIHDHGWMSPQLALERRAAGEIDMAPPTYITLDRLAGYPDVATALADTCARPPERFATRISLVEGGSVALYDGDAGYESGDPTLPGGRHRLWMLKDGWRYER
jgi:8-oxo-dGTP pyrophosphatase MutT (NUDIX family)